MKKPRVASHAASNYVPGARYRDVCPFAGPTSAVWKQETLRIFLPAVF
jgi:hypothetical protein